MILLGEDHIWTFVVVVFAFFQFFSMRRFTIRLVLTIKTITTHKEFLYIGSTDAFNHAQSSSKITWWLTLRDRVECDAILAFIAKLESLDGAQIQLLTDCRQQPRRNLFQRL